MSEVNFDDYDYIFSHQTHNDSFALEFGKLILSLDKWLGATGVLLDAAMLFDDLHSHISFEQWLSDNKTSIADLRFRQGVSATFMLRKYREDIGKEDRTPKVFVHVVPVGFGFDTVSTLTDAIASAPNDDLISQLDPSAQSRVTGKDGNQYDQTSSSYFTVNLGSKELKILHQDDTYFLFSQANETFQTLGNQVIAVPDNPSQWLVVMQDSYNNVRNLVASVEDFDVKQRLERMYRDNSIAFDRIQKLEQAYAQEIEKAKKYHVIKAVVGVAQLGLAVGNYVQDLDIAAAEKEQAERIEGKLDDLKNEVSSLKSNISDQAKQISKLKLSPSAKAYADVIVPNNEVENFSELSVGQYHEQLDVVETYKRTTYDIQIGNFGFTFSRTDEVE